MLLVSRRCMSTFQRIEYGFRGFGLKNVTFRPRKVARPSDDPVDVTLSPQVETLIDTQRPTEYEQAVRLIRDLLDVSVRNKTSQAFEARLSELRARHAKKVSLLSRLERAGLARG